MVSIIEQERNRYSTDNPNHNNHNNQDSGGGGDLEIRRRYKDAEPSVLELAEMMGRRFKWVVTRWWEGDGEMEKKAMAKG